mgnify:CR=1 FL=1
MGVCESSINPYTCGVPKTALITTEFGVIFAFATVLTSPKLLVAATPSTSNLLTRIKVGVPKALDKLIPETDMLLFVTKDMLPNDVVDAKPLTDRLLFVEVVAVPIADVLAKPLTDMLFTDVVVGVPTRAAAKTLDGVTLASA